MTAALYAELEGVHNFRPLAPYPVRGGGYVRAGTIFRSGALELMSEADRELLAARVRISTILDLRHRDEYAGLKPHPLADRVRPLSLFPEHIAQENLIAELNGLYGTGPSPERYFHYLQIAGPRIAEAMELFARPQTYPVLVHCTAGKDRTGVLLALLMDVLGVPDEDIAAEYGLSDASIDRLIRYLQSTGRVLEGTPEEIRARLSTPPERMAGFMRLIREHYGDASNYLRKEGVSVSTLTRIRELLIDHAAGAR